MKFKALTVIGVFLLCAAPTCAQISTPNKTKSATATTSALESPSAPEGLSGLTRDRAEAWADRTTQVAILLSLRCISRHGDGEEAEACFDAAIKCYYQSPGGMWEQLPNILKCVTDPNQYQNEAGENP
jgi:hypothetical protein